MIEIKITLNEPAPGRLGGQLELSEITNSSPNLAKIAGGLMKVLREKLHMPEPPSLSSLVKPPEQNQR